MSGGGMILAFRLARRELRGGVRDLRIAALCLALGVAAIAGVGSATRSINAELAAEARTLLGGDVEIALRHRTIDDAQRGFLSRAGALSETTEMRAMAHGNGRHLLVELKVVDDLYPLHGTVRVEPGMPLSQALGFDDGMAGAVVESGVLARLGLRLGDRMRVGEETFAVRAVLIHEPDRAAASFTLGPRVLIGQSSLGKTELIQPGSLVENRYRIRFASGMDPAAWIETLKAKFPDAGWRIRDLADAAPRIKDLVARLGLYLTLVGLASLLVGGVGVATAIKTYLDRRTATIATLRCLGASARLVFSIYLLQVLALASIGIAAGLVVGAALPIVLAPLIGEFLPVAPRFGIHMQPLALAAGYGLLTAILFALWPLGRTRHVPPNLLFRAIGAPAATRRDAAAIAGIAALAILLAILVIVSTADRPLALWFLGGVAVSFLAFRLAGLGLERLARAAARRSNVSKGHPTMRLALANLSRPGAPTPSVVLSLGIGLTVLTTVVMIEANLARQVKNDMPAHAPAFFFIDIQPSQIEAFETAVRSVPGVLGIDRVPHLRGRISKIAGIPADLAVIAPEAQWVTRSDRGVTYAARPPAGAKIVAGEWWPEDYQGPPLLSFDANAAKGMGVGVGDMLTINVLGREIDARIANLRRIEWSTLGVNFTIILSPGVLESAPQTHIASVTTTREAEDAVEAAIADRFANISAVRVKAAIETVASILDHVATALRFATAVTLSVGLLVLAAATAAGQEKRIYDSVILKVLGAERLDVLKTYTFEFAVIGLATATLACLLGTGAAFMLITEVMHTAWTFAPSAALAPLGFGLLVILAFGFVGCWRALTQPAAGILRAP
jgi:putative ABC transport system permease protein